MIIKYQDKFESIFYAVLYGNLTDCILVPQNQPDNLFSDVNFLNIDNISWPQILEQHNHKYGEIKWYDLNNAEFNQFKNNINLALRHWKPYKYQVIIQIIKSAVKFGLTYANQKSLNETKDFYLTVKQVNQEINQAEGQISFMPYNYNQGKFLLATYQEECQIGDLVLAKMQSKYLGYDLILKTPFYVYMLYKNKLYLLSAKNFPLQINQKALADFWQSFYHKLIKPKLKNTRPALV